MVVGLFLRGCHGRSGVWCADGSSIVGMDQRERLLDGRDDAFRNGQRMKAPDGLARATLATSTANDRHTVHQGTRPDGLG